MLHIKTKYSGTAATMAKGPGVLKRTMQGWLEVAYTKTLTFWHEHYRPEHFKESATAKYGYRARQPGYEKSKRADVGHLRPLVYSGESERATERFQIRLSARSATLAMGIGNLGWTPKRGRVNMREEVTKVTPRELDMMGGMFERTMELQMVNRHDWFEKTLG